MDSRQGWQSPLWNQAADAHSYSCPPWVVAFLGKTSCDKPPSHGHVFSANGGCQGQRCRVVSSASAGADEHFLGAASLRVTPGCCFRPLLLSALGR